MKRAPKPQQRDYKQAIKFLTEKKFELKYTKSGVLNAESIGYLKGYFDLDIELGVSMSLKDLLNLLLDEYSLDISADDIALYFRNERELLKDEATRLRVCSEFHKVFHAEISETFIDDCTENFHPELQDDTEDETVEQSYPELQDDEEFEGDMFVPTPEQYSIGYDAVMSLPGVF